MAWRESGANKSCRYQRRAVHIGRRASRPRLAGRLYRRLWWLDLRVRVIADDARRRVSALIRSIPSLMQAALLRWSISHRAFASSCFARR